MLFVSLFVSLSFGSEMLEKGSVLKEDSIVFTIEESERLKARILELEKKEKDLKIYKDLYSLESDKCVVLSNTVDLYKIKEKNYIEINNEYRSIIDSKNKQLKINKYENIGFFALGAATIVGSFYMTSSIINSQN